MTTPNPHAALAMRALALLDHLPDRGVGDIIKRRERQGVRIGVPPRRLSDLIDAVEAAYPGAIAGYLAAREVERRERAASVTPTPDPGESHDRDSTR